MVRAADRARGAYSNEAALSGKGDILPAGHGGCVTVWADPNRTASASESVDFCPSALGRSLALAVLIGPTAWVIKARRFCHGPGHGNGVVGR